METIKAVLFDYGMVLSGPPDPAAREEMKRILEVDDAKFHEIYWKHRDDYDRGTLKSVAYWEQVAHDLHRTLDAKKLSALIAADSALWTRPNQTMIDWAAALQQAGVKTGVLSNIGDCIGEGIVTRLPWLAAFDHCTWSYQLKLAKPDPEIYRRTAQALDAEPKDILFIDDREENIAAATALGFQAILYTTHLAFEHEMQARGLGHLLDANSCIPVL